MNDDLIRRYDVCDRCSDYCACGRVEVNCPVSESPAVAAVPVSELIEFRDFVYATDGITMRHLKMLNKLIAKYDGSSEMHIRGQRSLCHLFEDTCKQNNHDEEIK